MPTPAFDELLDDALLTALDRAAAAAIAPGPSGALLYALLRYHLGFLDDELQPARVPAGKRVRPRLAILACRAAGGDPRRAVHAAAAVELLHNFTLIHDDIQDESPLRRHRATLWSRWGAAQAINAGDAMFSVAHLALNRSLDTGVDAATVLELSSTLHETTLRIVEGQTLDLSFERRSDVSPGEYLTMIGGKTGALTRWACWTGARVADADPRILEALAEFGALLGVGFQIRDDILGVWGSERETGKARADDIRRRKKSLPVLLLRERASAPERARLDAIYADDDVTADEVEEILSLMVSYEIADDVQRQVTEWHDRARDLLLASTLASDARDELLALVDSLEERTG